MPDDFVFLAAFLAGDTVFLAADAVFLAAFLAGDTTFTGAAAAFLAGAFLAGAFLAACLAGAAAFFFSARFDWTDGDGDGRASSATRRGGSRPASTNGRSSPFLSTWRALFGGGVPMAVSGM